MKVKSICAVLAACIVGFFLTAGDTPIMGKGSFLTWTIASAAMFVVGAVGFGVRWLFMHRLGYDKED